AEGGARGLGPPPPRPGAGGGAGGGGCRFPGPRPLPIGPPPPPPQPHSYQHLPPHQPTHWPASNTPPTTRTPTRRQAPGALTNSLHSLHTPSVTAMNADLDFPDCAATGRPLFSLRRRALPVTLQLFTPPPL